MPRLFLMRHASAGWAGPGLRDFDRPLTEKGRSQATAVGKMMRERGLLPELVLCSSSERTRQTWSCVAAALGGPSGNGIRLTVNEAIYSGDAARIIEIVREAPACAAVLVVGHNPAMAELVATLPARGEAAAMRAVASGFPKGALAIMTCEEPLAHLAPRRVALDDFLRPEAV